MAPDYVTVGSITLDWVISAEGEMNLAGCGGAVLYAAAGAHLWNDSVAVVSRVGKGYRSEYLRDFSEHGVDVSAVRAIEEPHTQIALIEYEADGDRHGFDPHKVFASRGIPLPDILRDAPVSEDEHTNCEEESNLNPSPSDMGDNFWRAKGFHIAPLPHTVQEAFATRLNDRGARFTLDPGLDCEKDELIRFLSTLPIVLPSKEEADRLLGEQDLNAGIDRLARLGPKVVVVKLGRLGSMVHDAQTGRRSLVPVLPTIAKDPTGAGDAYCGGFLVGYSETQDPFESALRATVSASFVVEDFDARYALRFTRKDAEARLERLRLLAA